MNKFKVGDFVWWARFENTHKTEDCPVCYRKGVVTLTLGNGDEVDLKCQFCASGFEEPKGYVDAWEYETKVIQIQIEKVLIEDGPEGEKREYRYENYCLYDDLIFKDKEGAEKRALELAADYSKKRKEQQYNVKNSQFRSYSWKAGYHTKNANQAKKDVEYHENAAKVCKAKAKARRKEKLEVK